MPDDLERLQAFLPPIYTSHALALTLPSFLDVRVIDLEWHSVRCHCGRDLPDGALETIGIGNDKAVLQVDWQSLDAAARDDVRRLLAALVRVGTTIYHSAESDIRKMRENGVAVTAAGHARLEDTMLADAVLFSEEDHDLDDLRRRHGRLPEYKHLRAYAPAAYNAADVVSTFDAWRSLERSFAGDPQAHRVYREMSIPFIDLVVEGEEAGVRVNADVARALFAKYLERIRQATILARAYTGDPTLNLAAPDQVKWWVYNVYKMPVQRKRSTEWGVPGAATLEKDALATLRRQQGAEWDEEEEPTLEAALDNTEVGGWGAGLLEAKYLFNAAQQRLTHYVVPCLVVEGEGLDRRLVGVRDRIYPECRQHVQASGRHSYVGPALQQMKGETSTLVVPDPGTCWVGHDWSNIETWLLGVLAQDELILEAKAQGWDTHVVNFCDGTGTPRPPHLTKALHKCGCPGCVAWRASVDWKGEDDLRRTFFKRYVYRLHYRGRPEFAGDIPGARALGFDVPRLVATSEAYLSRHRALVQYWTALERQIDVEGLVRTFRGRPRRLTSPNRSARYREGSNHPMQGGVADIYIETALLVKRAAPWARLVYGAHDSQWWQVPRDRLAEFIALYAPIVEREVLVNGRPVRFPASFKVREAT